MKHFWRLPLRSSPVQQVSIGPCREADKRDRGHRRWIPGILLAALGAMTPAAEAAVTFSKAFAPDAIFVAGTSTLIFTLENSAPQQNLWVNCGSGRAPSA